MTSSDLRERSARPCSPSAQRSASARLLLPDPFGPDDGADPGPELDVRPLGERLEALQPEGEEARLGGRGPGARLTRRPLRASAPASPATARRRSDRLGGRGGLGGPARRALADAQQLAVDPDLDPERLLVVRARSRRRAGTTGRSPVRRWVYSWSRLLGLLSAPIGASASSSGVGQLDEPVADRRRTRDRGRARRRRPRTSRPGATAGAGRCAAPRPRRAGGRAEVDAGRPAGPARSSTRSRRGGRSGSPRRRRGGGRTAPRRWPG